MTDSIAHTQLFEKFEIIQTLKKDDYSAVYRALHIYLGGEIILKTLDTSNLSDSTLLERFKREAKILARLKHKNIINVLDFGTYSHYFYISFEYFESKNLREVIKDNSLSLDDKRRLFIQLLLGMQAAHESKIIHRDIKPDNVLVNRARELKIADFGLASVESDSMVTQKSSIVGTPGYMSPEQITGEVLTAQSDLFSAGIVAFELFTGLNPFLKGDIGSTINAILSYNDTLFAPLEALPQDIREVITKLLQRGKNKRYNDCGEVLQALDYTPEEVLVTESMKPGLGLGKTSLFVLLALCITCILGIWIWRSAAHQTQQNRPITDTSAVTNANQGAPAQTSPMENADSHKLPAALEKRLDNATEKNSPSNEAKPQQAYLISLVLDCTPWATVYIDSAKLDVTPVRQVVRLTEGKHLLKLVHPEYPIFQTTLNVKKDDNYFARYSLDSLFPKIRFNISPWGEVWVDQHYIGQTPLKKPVSVTAGKHLVTVTNPTLGKYETWVTVGKGEIVNFEHRFEAESK
ncbi:MAG: protein kinase [Ignavibacteria bacterium]|nr:protein kinase [Ignavibacteria bacterium]